MPTRNPLDRRCAEEDPTARANRVKALLAIDERNGQQGASAISPENLSSIRRLRR
jgi:hypothetical protein